MIPTNRKHNRKAAVSQEAGEARDERQKPRQQERSESARTGPGRSPHYLRGNSPKPGAETRRRARNAEAFGHPEMAKHKGMKTHTKGRSRWETRRRDGKPCVQRRCETRKQKTEPLRGDRCGSKQCTTEENTNKEKYNKGSNRTKDTRATR